MKYQSKMIETPSSRYMHQGFTLKSGKPIYANCGLLTIGLDGQLYEGYDGKLDIELTQEEKREISNHMIARWRKWRDTE